MPVFGVRAVAAGRGVVRRDVDLGRLAAELVKTSMTLPPRVDGPRRVYGATITRATGGRTATAAGRPAREDAATTAFW